VRDVRRKGSKMAFPKSRDEMRARGWRMLGLKTCSGRGCEQALELWVNPVTNQVSPMESTADFRAHFAFCPDAASFRRDRVKKKPEPPKSGNLFQ
jgi:hypothetical protein